MNYRYYKGFKQQMWLSKSLKVIGNHAIRYIGHTISYLSSIVTMSLSCTVSEILSLISENLKIIKLCTEFEIYRLRSPITNIWKATKNTETGMVWGLGVTQGHWQHSYLIEHMTSYSTLIETMHLSCIPFSSYYRLFPKNLKTSHDRDHAHARDSL